MKYTLFPDDGGREHFLYLPGACLQGTDSRCYAWVLMDTHYHLVLRIGDRELWEVQRVAEYLGVSAGAVSAMIQNWKEIFKKKGIII